ncbi:MAG: alpha/beta hydrolase [Acidimicrobiia bacterium]|jgi:2-hydroxy-6-oxonona-2,4-dienedioate hydrolase
MNEERYRETERRLWSSVGLTPSERFVTMPTLGVRVRVQEVGEGDPVLFIHGGPNAGSTWAGMVEHLDGFRCLLVDRPGTGLSDPYPIREENLAEVGERFVGGVLDGLGLESAHVVASSLGGHLALRSAAAHPARIGRMVQMACPALVPGDRLPPFMRLMTVGWVRRILGHLPPSRRANRSILRQIGHATSVDAGIIPESFWDWYAGLQQHTDTMHNDGEMIGRLCSLRGSKPALRLTPEVLEAVATPTLFLWGADDSFGDETVARRLVGLMPNAELVMLPRAGHLPWLDAPAAVAERSAHFLRLGRSPRTPEAGDPLDHTIPR